MAAHFPNQNTQYTSCRIILYKMKNVIFILEIKNKILKIISSKIFFNQHSCVQFSNEA